MSKNLTILNVLQKSLLKSIAAYINTNKDYHTHLCLLGTVSYICYNESSKTAQKKCIKCHRLFENVLLLVLHLQLVHNDSLFISKYQFENRVMTIFLKQSYSNQPNELMIEQNGQINLLYYLKDRIKKIFDNIFSKFLVKKSRNQRKYYSAIDIFYEIQDDCQGNEEEDINSIQRELQKMRISQFSDVSQSQKHFILTWNDFMNKKKRSKCFNYVDSDTMSDITLQYSKMCRGLGIQRNNLLIHLWTLWATGKIPADHINFCLQTYDKSIPSVKQK